MHLAPLRAHLDGGLGMRTQVVEPAGMARIPALRGDDHEVLAVLDVEQRGGPPRVALRAHVVEQEHRRQAGEGVADPLAAEPVDDRVAPQQLIHEGPHPLLHAAGDVHAHNHARLSRRRRPSTWDWPNEPVATGAAALRWSPFPGSGVGPRSQRTSTTVIPRPVTLALGASTKLAPPSPSGSTSSTSSSGFEGGRSVEESPSSNDFVASKPGEDVDHHCHGYPAFFSHAAHLDLHEYRFADLRERVRSHAKVAENAAHVGRPVPNAVMATVGLGHVRKFREVVQLGSWMPGSDPLLIITPIKCLDGSPKDLHVLLRHSPLGIPP